MVTKEEVVVSALRWVIHQNLVRSLGHIFGLYRQRVEESRVVAQNIL